MQNNTSSKQTIDISNETLEQWLRRNHRERSIDFFEGTFEGANWQKEKDKAVKAGKLNYIVDYEGGETEICKIIDSTKPYFQTPIAIADTEDNAAFICLAVNNHDKLIEALKDFLKVINRSPAALYHYGQVIINAEEILKSIESKDI